MRRFTPAFLFLAACGGGPSPEIGGTAVEGVDGDDDAVYEDGGVAEVPEACAAETPAFGDPIRRRATAASPGGNLASIAVAELAPDVLYGCTSEAGLVTWNVSDPANPVQSATQLGEASCDDVAVDAGGTWLVTASVSHVQLWEPGPEPTLLATWQADVRVDAAIVHEGRVFVAAGRDGVIELEPTGPTMSEVRRFADATSDARALAMSAAGDELLVAEARGGVRTYDPSTLQPTGELTVDGVAVDVAFDGDRLLVAALDGVHVETPGSDPAFVETPGTAVAVADGGWVADWIGLQQLTATDDGVDASGEPLFASEPLARFVDVADNGDAAFATDGDRLVVLIGSGAGAPDIWLEEPRVDVLGLEAGGSKSRALVLHNPGSADLQLCGITSDLEGVSSDTEQAVIAAGGSLPIEVSVASADGASASGSLTFVSNDPDESEFSVPLRVNPDRIDVGEPMAAFNQVGVDGRPLSSRDIEGQVVFLTYFATW